MQIYSINDIKSRTFGTPFFQQNDVSAIRVFRAEINRVNDANMLYLYPGEYDLVLVGAFDELTGVITPSTGGPVKLTNGLQLVNKTEK